MLFVVVPADNMMTKIDDKINVIVLECLPCAYNICQDGFFLLIHKTKA